MALTWVGNSPVDRAAPSETEPPLNPVVPFFFILKQNIQNTHSSLFSFVLFVCFSKFPFFCEVFPRFRLFNECSRFRNFPSNTSLSICLDCTANIPPVVCVVGLPFFLLFEVVSLSAVPVRTTTVNRNLFLFVWFFFFSLLFFWLLFFFIGVVIAGRKKEKSGGYTTTTTATPATDPQIVLVSFVLFFCLSFLRLLPVCCDCRFDIKRNWRDPAAAKKTIITIITTRRKGKRRRRKKTNQKEEEIQLREFVSITDAGYHSNVQVSHAM